MDETKPPRQGMIPQSYRETSSTGEKTKPYWRGGETTTTNDETKPPRQGVSLRSRRGWETSSSGEETKPPLRYILKRSQNLHYDGWDETSMTRGDSAIQERKRNLSTGKETKLSQYIKEESKHTLKWMRRNLLEKGWFSNPEEKPHLQERRRNLRYILKRGETYTAMDETKPPRLVEILQKRNLICRRGDETFPVYWSGG